MESVLTFIITILVYEWTLVTLGVLAIVFDYNEHNFMSGLFAALMFSGLYLILSKLDNFWFIFDWKFIVAYFVIGFAWSLFKYKLRVVHIIKEYMSDRIIITERDRDVLREIISLNDENVRKIMYWIIFFPISMIGWILQDALKWVVSDVLGKIYTYVYETTLNKLIKINPPMEEK